MFDRAVGVADEMGTLRGSFTEGEGNLVGALGEEIVLQFLPDAVRCNTYDYDLIYRGNYVDVKAATATVAPRPDFEASVSSWNTRQACDLYIFTRIKKLEKRANITLRNCPHGWIIGWMGKIPFYDRANQNRKGDPVPGQIRRDGTQFTYPIDCFSMPFPRLEDPDLLFEFLAEQAA